MKRLHLHGWQPLHATFAHLIQLHEDTSHNASHYTICTWDKSHSNSARASTYSHLSKCSRHIVCYALRPLQSSSDWFLICKKNTLHLPNYQIKINHVPLVLCTILLTYLLLLPLALQLAVGFGLSNNTSQFFPIYH
jgi:hypothetical protein